MDTSVNDESSEEIVEIDDDDKGDSFPDPEVAKLLNFDGFVITSSDYSTLERGEFLNDTVIEFYLTWLLKEKVTESQREEIHVFSSHFYSRLISEPIVNNSKVHAFERDPNKSKAEKAHLRVKGWTKKFDIFSKKLLIIPICQNYHWFMVLVCNPDCVGLKKDDQKIQGEPFFVILDSLGQRRAKEVEVLRTYLQHEYLEKRNTAFSFGSRNMRALYPRLPQQMNSTDCGVFLLEYAERIIEKRYVFRWPPLPDLTNWFTESEIFSKRPEIAQLIQTLSKKAHPEDFSHLTFPTISFAPIDVDEIDDPPKVYYPRTRRKRSYKNIENPTESRELSTRNTSSNDRDSDSNSVEEATSPSRRLAPSSRRRAKLVRVQSGKAEEAIVISDSDAPSVTSNGSECRENVRKILDRLEPFHQKLREKYSMSNSRESPKSSPDSTLRPSLVNPSVTLNQLSSDLIRRTKGRKKFSLCLD